MLCLLGERSMLMTLDDRMDCTGFGDGYTSAT